MNLRPERREDRDALIRRLHEAGEIRFGEDALAPDGAPLSGVVRAERISGVLRLRSTARMLHMTKEV